MDSDDILQWFIWIRFDGPCEAWTAEHEPPGMGLRRVRKNEFKETAEKWQKNPFK